jgi:hypothetical protein
MIVYLRLLAAVLLAALKVPGSIFWFYYLLHLMHTINLLQGKITMPSGAVSSTTYTGANGQGFPTAVNTPTSNVVQRFGSVCSSMCHCLEVLCLKCIRSSQCLKSYSACILSPFPPHLNPVFHVQIYIDSGSSLNNVKFELAVDSSTIPSFSSSTSWCQNNIKGTQWTGSAWAVMSSSPDCSKWPTYVGVTASTVGYYGFVVCPYNITYMHVCIYFLTEWCPSSGYLCTD